MHQLNEIRDGTNVSHVNLQINIKLMSTSFASQRRPGGGGFWLRSPHRHRLPARRRHSGLWGQGGQPTELLSLLHLHKTMSYFKKKTIYSRKRILLLSPCDKNRILWQFYPVKIGYCDTFALKKTYCDYRGGNKGLFVLLSRTQAG